MPAGLKTEEQVGTLSTRVPIESRVTCTSAVKSTGNTSSMGSGTLQEDRPEPILVYKDCTDPPPGSALQCSTLRVTAQQIGMTRASCGSHDRALGQILTRLSLSSPICEMDRKLAVPASQHCADLSKISFCENTSSVPTTESTPNTPKCWGVHITVTRGTHTITTQRLLTRTITEPGSTHYITALRSTLTSQH